MPLDIKSVQFEEQANVRLRAEFSLITPKTLSIYDATVDQNGQRLVLEEVPINLMFEHVKAILKLYQSAAAATGNPLIQPTDL